jgi:hypothetical protein
MNELNNEYSVVDFFLNHLCDVAYNTSSTVTPKMIVYKSFIHWHKMIANLVQIHFIHSGDTQCIIFLLLRFLEEILISVTRMTLRCTHCTNTVNFGHVQLDAE